jgi:mono/diheme cytochrome c family protein/rhodanese-related sulfurtransferase
MRFHCFLALAACLLTAASASHADDPFAFTEEDARAASADYAQYCALCHGADREGYANDDAPSLRSKSLIRSGFPIHMGMAIAYGRRGTPMGGYLDEIGGPFDRERLGRLLTWLAEMVDAEPVDLPFDPVPGDVDLGRAIYDEQCAICHGGSGEGALGPAIGNPSMLALTTDAFIRYAIEHGRDGTQMPAFGEVLSAEEIDSVTAFLRTRATGWQVERPVLKTPPAPGEYVLNPQGDAPAFDLKDGRYVKAADLNRALEEGRRMVLLDTRVPSMWQVAHIEGSVPIPYYTDRFEGVAANLPDDGTWIVSYCECPRAAAETVDYRLRQRGFKNTAVLWEGIQGWVALGFPVSMGQASAPQAASQN